MSLDLPTCPSCGGPLSLTHSGELDSWACPAGHGVALTTSEADGLVQEDELAELWRLAHQARPTTGARACPVTGRPMVAVEVPYDADEAAEGAAGDTAATGSVWVDVSVDERLVWFDAGEIDQFPRDLPDPEPSAEELAKVDEIRAAFGQQLVESAHTREAASVTERVYRHIARHRGLTRTLTEVGSLGRR